MVDQLVARHNTDMIACLEEGTKVLLDRTESNGRVGCMMFLSN